jgi:hypothetical protein
MNTKALIIMMLLISASTLGLVGFFTGTAEHYGVSTTEIDTFKAHFGQYTSIDTKLKALQTSLTNIQVLNPITWNNIILLVINFFSVLFELPFMFNAIVYSMVTMTGFLPSFTVYIIEGAVLLIVVFGALQALKGGNA